MNNKPPLLPVLLQMLLAACLLGACATQTYRAKPIAPEQAARQWRERSLQSPLLQAYMAGQGHAENRLPVKEWGLPELTMAAFFFHPNLELARAQWQAAQAMQATAAQKLNPSLNTSAEHHSKASGVSPWTLGVALDFTLEASGKREARMEHAASLSEAARLDSGQTAWQVRSHLRLRLLDYYAVLRQVELLQEETAARAEIVRLLETRLGAGLISDVDVSDARLQFQKTQAILDAETSRIPELQATLAAAVGLPALALATATLQLSAFDRIVAADRLPAAEIQRAALLNRLDIRAALARYSAAEAKFRLEIAKQRPDIALGPGYSFDQGDNRWSLGLSLALAWLNKNEGPIAEALAQREVEARRFEALQARVIGEQEQGLVRYLASLDELAKAEGLRNAVTAKAALIEKQFDAGYSDRIELAGTRLEGISAEQAVSDARIRTQRALGALEDAVQQPLDGSAPLPDLFAARNSEP
ncbi:MAG: TolC family protein [Pseudomonadota bacterium]